MEEKRTRLEFDKIYEEYYPKILRYLSGITESGDAEDLAQEVFEKAGRGFADFRGQSKISTWLYRIATNTAIDRSRSSAYKQSRNSTAIEDAEEAEIRDGGVCPTERNVIRKEMSDCVREFMDKLPQDYRTILTLGEIREFSNKEIADILGISADNAKVRLHRARNMLRKELDAGCDFFRDEQNVFVCDRKQNGILPKKPE